MKKKPTIAIEADASDPEDRPVGPARFSAIVRSGVKVTYPRQADGSLSGQIDPKL